MKKKTLDILLKKIEKLENIANELSTSLYYLRIDIETKMRNDLE